MDGNSATPWNPQLRAELTPAAFEALVLAWLQTCGSVEDKPIAANHLGLVRGAGGEYRIDVLVELTLLGGATITILVECKHQARPVEREDAMVLEAKLRDVGAHKGMMFSSSGFQRGALQYAAAHGIATIAVVDGKWLYQTRDITGRRAEPPPWMPVDTYAGIRMTPTDTGVSCHTIEMERVDALEEWLANVSKPGAR